jgi:hypothetical protein
MNRFENVGLFIREKVWLQPNLSPALHVTMACTGTILRDRDNSDGIATRYGLDGPGIESR